MIEEKFKKLLTKIPKLDREVINDFKDELISEQLFIDFVKKTKDWTEEEHNGLVTLLEPKKNQNGYYEDKFGGRVSYNGIRTLKKSKTELSSNILHDIENDKCRDDFKYFRKYYCFITTKTGLARPEPRHYQEHLEDELLSLEDLIILYPRQSGKTVTAATYLLWLSIYHPISINIGIVANKPKTAREVLDKIKKIFSELPIWMMKGIEVWNKSEIEYENQTRIMTDSPSSDSFRGYTCNIIYTDEAAYIKKSLWDEFIDAVMPTMNSLIFKQVISTSTANGMNHFFSLVNGAKDTTTSSINTDLSKEDEIHIGHDSVLTMEELYDQFQNIKTRREVIARGTNA